MSGQHVGFDLIRRIHRDPHHNQECGSTEIEGNMELVNQDLGQDAHRRDVQRPEKSDPCEHPVDVIRRVFPRPDPRLRIGQSVTARVFTGEEQDALVVPAGALVNDAGADVVYVQTGGERFERRLVRVGLRDGEHVAIEEGLAPGERVVTRGAYLVHLAAGAPAETGHGHAH